MFPSSDCPKRPNSPLFLALLFLCLVSLTSLILTVEQKQERTLFWQGKPFSKTLNLLNLMLKTPKNKVSPLYLINGTICRYVNNVPICTVLATTGLQSEYTV